MAAVLPADGLPLSASRARARRNLAISSSMAFNIWSFKLVPFRPEEGRMGTSLSEKNNRFGRISPAEALLKGNTRDMRQIGSKAQERNM